MNINSGLSALDYVEIQNLYGFYNLASDAGDADAYAACFTEDAVLRIETLDMTVTGRANLHAFKLKDAAGRGGRYRRHWNGSLHLRRRDDGTVLGRCYLQAFNGNPGSLPELADVGCYEDTILQEAGEWRFAKRIIRMDGTSFTPPAE